MTNIGFASPEEAEDAFYRAFESGDLEAMMRVWDTSDDIVCIHPLGQRATGRGEVGANWADILSSGVRMHFHVDGVRQFQSPELVVRLVQEHIRFAGKEPPRKPILATNAYRLGAGGWLMVLHHAAPQMVESQEESPRGTLH